MDRDDLRRRFAGAAKLGVLGRRADSLAVTGTQARLRFPERRLVAGGRRHARLGGRRASALGSADMVTLARLHRHRRGGDDGLGLPIHGNADDPDVLRPVGAPGIAVGNAGEVEGGDIVHALAPAADLGRLRRRKDVTRLGRGGSLAAERVDAVHRNDGQHPAGALVMQHDGVAVAGSAGDIEAALVAEHLESLTTAAVEHTDIHQGAGVGKTDAGSQRQGGKEGGELVHEGLLG